MNANRRIARAAGTVMVAFVISNLAGLTRQILVAQAFGTTAEMEAFSAANRVSETLFLLVAGGALSSAFIPTFTGMLSKGERNDAWKLASAIANLSLVVLAVLSLLSALFAPQIVRYVLAPGFATDPTKEALTIALLRIQLPSAAIFGISGLIMGILNSHQVFFAPALTPALYQLGMIFGVLFLSPWLGIFGLAWGVVIGSILHLGMQLPALFRLHGKYSFILGLRFRAVREVFWLMGPRLLGVAVVQLNFWVNTRLASQMAEGSVTGVVLAFALMLMPQAAIAQSVAIAAMPTFSAQFALGKLSEMRSALTASLRGILFLSAPAMLGLIILREPIVALLYQRGEFTSRSTELVAWALLWYSVGLIGHCIVEILSRTFYAMHDTRTPVFVGIGAMSLNVLLSFVFSQFFFQIGWLPHGGLALANSLATSLEAIALLLIIRKRLSGLNAIQLLDILIRTAIATLFMGAGMWVCLSTFDLKLWQQVFFGIGIGILIYLLSAALLRVKEIQAGLQLVRSKMR
jgi:putative peptidoglycan lipid II flippase